jgi:hypothetical protein
VNEIDSAHTLSSNVDDDDNDGDDKGNVCDDNDDAAQSAVRSALGVVKTSAKTRVKGPPNTDDDREEEEEEEDEVLLLLPAGVRGVKDVLFAAQAIAEVNAKCSQLDAAAAAAAAATGVDIGVGSHDSDHQSNGNADGNDSIANLVANTSGGGGVSRGHHRRRRVCLRIVGPVLDHEYSETVRAAIEKINDNEESNGAGVGEDIGVGTDTGSGAAGAAATAGFKRSPSVLYCGPMDRGALHSAMVAADAVINTSISEARVCGGGFHVSPLL